MQVYPESADRGDFYANYVREHGRAEVPRLARMQVGAGLQQRHVA